MQRAVVEFNDSVGPDGIKQGFMANNVLLVTSQIM